MNSIKTINEVFKFYNVVDDVKYKITDELKDTEEEYFKLIKEVNFNDIKITSYSSVITLKCEILKLFIQQNLDDIFIKDTDYNNVINRNEQLDDMTFEERLMKDKMLFVMMIIETFYETNKNNVNQLIIDKYKELLEIALYDDGDDEIVDIHMELYTKISQYTDEDSDGEEYYNEVIESAYDYEFYEEVKINQLVDDIIKYKVEEFEGQI